MTARAMWKAEIDIEEVRIPVKLYAAVADTSVHFRLLHEKDHAPVKQQMVDPETHEPVAPELIRRAVEVDRGMYVVIKPGEQEALEPKPSRAISVERVVSAEKLDERWFDRPYYLGPDGDDDAYFASRARARKELLDRDRALGHAQEELCGALYGSDGYLLLDTLRNAREVVQIGSVRPPAEGARPILARSSSPSSSSARSRTEFDAAAYKRRIPRAGARAAGSEVERQGRPLSEGGAP